MPKPGRLAGRSSLIPALRTIYRIAPRLVLLAAILRGLVVVLGVTAVVAMRHTIVALQVKDIEAARLAAAACVTAGALAGAATHLFRWASNRLTDEAAVWSQAALLERINATPLDTYESTSFHNELQVASEHARTQLLQCAVVVATLVGNVLTLLPTVGFVLLRTPIVLPIVLLACVPSLWAGRRRVRRQLTWIAGAAPAERGRQALHGFLSLRGSLPELRSLQADTQLLQTWKRATRQRVADLRVFYRSNLGRDLAASAVACLLVLGALSMIFGGSHLSTSRIETLSAAVVVLVLLVPVAAVQAGTFYFIAQAVEQFQAFVNVREPDVAYDALAPLESVRLRDVTFSYATGEAILSGVDLELAAGEVLLVVGDNGAGKTTMLKVLAGVHAPTTGTYLWNGRPVTGPSEQIGYLPQVPARLPVTVREFVGLGADPQPPLDVLEKAAAAVGAADLIAKLPNGWDSNLSPEFLGIDLSTGQWQRLALARLVARGSSLILLDEPFAAQDSTTEKLLTENLRSLFPGAAVVVVSHRPMPAATFDRVVHLSGGRLREGEPEPRVSVTADRGA